MEENVINKKSYSTIDAYKIYLCVFIFMLIFSLIIAMVSVIIAGSLNIELNELYDNPIFVYAQYLLSPIMFVSIILWYNRKKEYNNIATFGIKQKLNLKFILLAIAMSFFAIIFFSQFASLFDILLEKINFNPDDNLNIPNSSFGYLCLNTLIIAVLPAICEELVFRGLIFKSLSQEHSPTFAILISALMFSLMHGSLQQTLFQFIIGIILGYVMFSTGNILYPIITHFFNNFIVLLFDFINNVTNIGQVANDSSVIGVEVYITAVVLAIIGTIALVYLIKHSIKNHKYNKDLVFKHFKSYTNDEKKYFYLSFGFGILIWITNTISMFGVS